MDIRFKHVLSSFSLSVVDKLRMMHKKKHAESHPFPAVPFSSFRPPNSVGPFLNSYFLNKYTVKMPSKPRKKPNAQMKFLTTPNSLAVNAEA